MKDIENIMLFLLNNGESTSHRLATILNIKVRRVGMILRKATIQGIVSKSTINTPDGKKTVWSANGESCRTPYLILTKP